jgi:hypothetical protein
MCQPIPETTKLARRTALHTGIHVFNSLPGRSTMEPGTRLIFHTLCTQGLVVELALEDAQTFLGLEETRRQPAWFDGSSALLRRNDRQLLNLCHCEVRVSPQNQCTWCCPARVGCAAAARGWRSARARQRTGTAGLGRGARGNGGRSTIARLRRRSRREGFLAIEVDTVAEKGYRAISRRAIAIAAPRLGERFPH